MTKAQAETNRFESVELARRVLDAAVGMMMTAEALDGVLLPVDALISAAHTMPSPKWAYRSAFRAMQLLGARATFDDMLRTARWCAKQEH